MKYKIVLYRLHRTSSYSYYTGKRNSYMCREVLYNRVGHWIKHCEYGPAIEQTYLSPHTKNSMTDFYLRNRHMSRQFWEENLSKLSYRKK